MSQDLEDDEMAWLRAWTEEVRAGLDRHPEPERLVAYVEGKLSLGEAEELRDHLALCPECTSVVLDFARIARPAPEDALSEKETILLWPDLRESLREEGLLTTRPLPAAVAMAMLPRSSPSSRAAWALAATLGVAVVGLSLWSAALLRESRELRGPRTNIHIVDLLPMEAGAGSRDEDGSAGEKVNPPPTAESVVLVLNTADLRSFPRYGLEIRAATDDRLLWSTDRLARSVRGNFTVEVPRALLEGGQSGQVRLLLFGFEGERREPLAEYQAELWTGR